MEESVPSTTAPTNVTATDPVAHAREWRKKQPRCHRETTFDKAIYGSDEVDALLAAYRAEGEQRWIPVSELPKVGGTYHVGAWITEKNGLRHFVRAYAVLIHFESGPKWIEPLPKFEVQYWAKLLLAPQEVK